eukprot:TRINITY_DN72115_c0_g1_i1.p1 TRINITY_DN72115_c0_g1~~TRINITY_DN72115_c0_g1_i1.p1  ORF type:complete len:110 (+),score=8.79 TRINITY_DN72115_c0_g1_i1:196-525(+)
MSSTFNVEDLTIYVGQHTHKDSKEHSLTVPSNPPKTIKPFNSLSQFNPNKYPIANPKFSHKIPSKFKLSPDPPLILALAPKFENTFNFHHSIKTSNSHSSKPIKPSLIL